MNNLVRVGLVGVGIIAGIHLEVLSGFPRVALEFTVDPHRPEPPEFGGTHPSHYRDLPEALGAHEPDLLVIATPTDTHCDLSIQALTGSRARVLVEKPLVHDLPSLSRLRALDNGAPAGERLFTAHHFAFSPEVRWAAEQLAGHPEWGPVADITSAFHDPYVLRGEQAFASYVSSWTDSGVNQLSMLARFVDVIALTSAEEMDSGASAWRVYRYRSAATEGSARLRTSWLTGSSSKETVLRTRSGVEIWIDHTAMTGFAADGGTLLATHGNNGRVSRKVAHYRPLYESLLSDHPDPVLGFRTAAAITELHQARIAPSDCE
ncbi:hypothetical protein GCM10009716_44070 [Streptomyces sodiiphilus]|uniref:Gfo/Idh/MocA-like oxidoreductase N-terminal domain-containing protein n=1 Tax=Streptomyces sodiiphilus TaxID=226217 RepID=A0ABN2PUM7_9ACTN